jgi:beta-N-acetylhexosaminidase
VILFGRNLDSAARTTVLLRELRRLVPHPLLCALDQEGGRVSRLESWIGTTPTAERLARQGEQTLLRFGRATARGLHSLGFNLDFAPVVDLCTPGTTNGIGDRSFGTDPERTSLLAGAFLDGLQGEGVAGCLKHFPGLGPTSVDSHEQLPTAERDADGLRRLDLVPYRRLGARAASVMVGHGHYPGLDASPGIPATLSSTIVNGLLREEIGYHGLVVSDDLEMGAVAPLDQDGSAAVRAIRAGCDLLLYCASLERAERAAAALARQATDETAFAHRLTRASRTVAAAADRWVPPVPSAAAWETARRELGAFSGLA